ncbi:MAG: endonuclease/exonuclease/phosphatase family protein [Myxococcales bacterium]|nr:endonuclease/exonuclease/phosphatase family protein [Myxococcales bacterium]
MQDVYGRSGGGRWRGREARLRLVSMFGVTWNVQGLNEEHISMRSEAAAQEIVLGCSVESLVSGTKPKPPPTVVLLQEVTQRTWPIFRTHLGRAGFRFYPDEPPDRSYFELTAIGASATVVTATTESLPFTMYGRELHVLEIEQGSFRLRVMQAHFDSGAEQRASEVRMTQAQAVLSRMMASHKPALFAGDTNLRSHEWSLVQASPVTDAWEALGQPKWGESTWPALGFRGRKARFDRVWLHPTLQVKAMYMLGTTRVPGIRCPPSDHLGIRFEFEASAD